MQTLLLALLFGLILSRGVFAEVAWQSDYETSVAEAASAGKPILLCFTAVWCGPCRLMHATTFTDPAVQEALQSHIAIKIDFDRSPELIAKYHITGVPTLVLLNRFGETVATQVGYLDAKDFLTWLGTNRTAATVAVSKAQVARDKATALDAALNSTDPAAREHGLAQLFESYLNKDDLAPVAGKLIEQLADTRRDEVVPHLNDEHLAIRILLSNLLAKSLGASFVFDPWAPAAEREAALRGLQK